MENAIRRNKRQMVNESWRRHGDGFTERDDSQCNECGRARVDPTKERKTSGMPRDTSPGTAQWTARLISLRVQSLHCKAIGY